MVTFVVDEAHCVKKWGENIRREFSNLGEVRSLLPEDVNIMALTATASQATCKQVCRTLGMVRPAYIIKTPDKPNIHLSVKQKPDSVEEASQTLPYIDRTGYNICQNYSNIYKYFDNRLGPEITEPIGVDKVAPVKLVNLYTVHGTKPKVKDAILSSFCSPCGILRAYRCLWHGDGCSSHCSLEVVQVGMEQWLRQQYFSTNKT